MSEGLAFDDDFDESYWSGVDATAAEEQADAATQSQDNPQTPPQGISGGSYGTSPLPGYRCEALGLNPENGNRLPSPAPRLAIEPPRNPEL